MYSIELQTVFYEYQKKIIKLKPSFVSREGPKFNLKIFHFDIRGKLSIIRCDKYILFLDSREISKKELIKILSFIKNKTKQIRYIIENSQKRESKL